MISWIKKLFKKKERIPEVEIKITIPHYVSRIEEKYNKDLTDDYKELIRDGITGRSIIKKTLILNCKMNK